MAYIPMINPETGEVDAFLVAERAELRACREYGSPNPPPAARREARQWCEDRAAAERRQWRDHRGLPREELGELVMMPSWGASGDSYGAR